MIEITKPVIDLLKQGNIKIEGVEIDSDLTSKSIDSHRNEITRSRFLRTTYSCKEERKTG